MYKAPDRGYPLEEVVVVTPPLGYVAVEPATVDAAGKPLPVRSLPEDEARAVAAAYNALQTNAAKAWFLGNGYGKQHLGDHMGQEHGAPYYEWLNGILGLAKPEEYSGSAGVAEIAAAKKDGWPAGPKPAAKTAPK